MLYFLLTRHHSYTVRHWLQRFERELGGSVRLLPYQQARGPLARGTFIFGDLDRLTPRLHRVAVSLHARARGAGCQVLNDPSSFLRRYELHRALGECYRSFRATEPLPDDLRLPAFLRMENEHRKPLTMLLPTRDAIERARQRYPDALVVEYLDTSDDSGVFRKYGAFRIGAAICPRHLLFSRDWIVKGRDLVDPAFLDEELEYLHTNPHEEALRTIFDTARLTYGRIDYSVVEGKIHTWEINTNPSLRVPKTTTNPARREAIDVSAAQINAAFRALHADHGETFPRRWLWAGFGPRPRLLPDLRSDLR